MWLLGFELRTFGRAVHALNHRAISPAPVFLFQSPPPSSHSPSAPLNKVFMTYSHLCECPWKVVTFFWGGGLWAGAASGNLAWVPGIKHRPVCCHKRLPFMPSPQPEPPTFHLFETGSVPVDQASLILRRTACPASQALVFTEGPPLPIPTPTVLLICIPKQPMMFH